MWIFKRKPRNKNEKYSSDSTIIEALDLLDKIEEKDVFENLDKSGSQIQFYDLSLLHFSYAKHCAVSSTDDSGNNYILINQNYQGSPVPCISCLIAHESVHQLPQATLEEEVQAHTKEVEVWEKVKGLVPKEAMGVLVAREKNLLDKSQTIGLDTYIRGMDFYNENCKG